MTIIYGTISVQLENRFAENALHVFCHTPFLEDILHLGMFCIAETKETITSYKLNAYITR